MPAHPPEITLSSDDKRLLHLLGQLVTAEVSDQPNFHLGTELVLSDTEARELVALLEEFAASSRFIDGSHFVEELYGPKDSPQVDAREIYLKWRKRNGRSRAMASTHWREFTVRLGLSANRGGYLGGGPNIQARRMDIHKFLELERALLENSNLNPRVRSLVLRLVAAQANELEALRNGNAVLPKYSLTKLPLRIAQEISVAHKSSIGVKPMSTNKLAGIITVVVDMSALFTTRDWNVVGTLSALAGALVSASE